MSSKKRSNNASSPVSEDVKYNEGDINNIIEKRIRLKCRNQKQKEYANLITNNEIVICVGPAGTGKTHIAIARAIELLQNKTNKYNKLIICKPAIEAGEKLGFLPGTVRDKMAPIMESLIDVIDKLVGKDKRIQLEEKEIIKLQTLAFIRGKTLDNSILVLDEAQNMTNAQIKTVLTRIGANSKFVISGDLDQSDVFKNFKQSGLYDAWTRHRNIPDIGFFEFDESDIVRNPIISKILKNYKPQVKGEDKVTPPPPPPPRLLVDGKKPKPPLSDSKDVSKIKNGHKNKLRLKNFLNKFQW